HVADGEHLGVGGRAPVLLALRLLAQHHGAGGRGVVQDPLREGEGMERGDQAILGALLLGRRSRNRSLLSSGGRGGLGVHSFSFVWGRSREILRGPAGPYALGALSRAPSRERARAMLPTVPGTRGGTWRTGRSAG